MKAILSKTSSPYLNLATEEYLLKNHTEEFIFLYRNEKSLIIGKHQNSNLEVNVELQHELQIPIIRRLSGGGTVFHDLGNLNFCFITNEANQKQINFEKYAKPIQEALLQMGIKIEIGKRHEFMIEGKKISGNASHIWKNRVIHHGTLLYNSDTDLLTNLLKIDPSKYVDKSVKSVSSHVITISQACNLSMDMEQFTSGFLQTISAVLTAESTEDFLEPFEEKIKEIATTKYSSWEWNHGYNPNYVFIKTLTLNNSKKVSLQISIEKGKIIKLEMATSDENRDFENILTTILLNNPHSVEIIRNSVLSHKAKLEHYMEAETLIRELF